MCITVYYSRETLSICTRKLPNWLILLYSICCNVKNNLLLKSYGPMASFHKVIKLLKFKSTSIPMEGAIERAHSVAKSDLVALSQWRSYKN